MRSALTTQHRRVATLATLLLATACGHAAPTEPTQATDLTQPGAPTGYESRTHCETTGPRSLRPVVWDQVFLKMSRLEIEPLLGPPAHCPGEGVCYYGPFVPCEAEAPQAGIEAGAQEKRHTGECGFIVEYQGTGSVQSCAWGPILE